VETRIRSAIKHVIGGAFNLCSDKEIKVMEVADKVTGNKLGVKPVLQISSEKVIAHF